MKFEMDEVHSNFNCFADTKSGHSTKKQGLAWLDNHQQGAMFTIQPLKSSNSRDEISTSKTAWHSIKILVPS
jgi:hypothetical protein